LGDDVESPCGAVGEEKLVGLPRLIAGLMLVDGETSGIVAGVDQGVPIF
jgi:hypothetical protein